VAEGSSVHARHGSDPLGRASVFRRLQGRNTGQRGLAVTAFDRRALLVDSLTDENATRGTHSTELVLKRIVRVARALTRPTRITHVIKLVGKRLKCSKENERVKCVSISVERDRASTSVVWYAWGVRTGKECKSAVPSLRLD
jgi:hypothetical protein